MTDIVGLGPWQMTTSFPTNFHSLGLHLEDSQRVEHLESVASSVWPRGTDFQRETAFRWYAEIAAAAAADGAFYGGFCLSSTDDDRISTASLLARLDKLAEQDATVAAAGLREALSQNPSNDVHRVDVPCGPAVLLLTGIEWTPSISGNGEQSHAEPLSMARADVYIPLSVMSQLLVISMTTPSLQELPQYVGLLSHIAESVAVTPTDSVAPADSQAAAAGADPLSVRDVFG